VTGTNFTDQAVLRREILTAMGATGTLFAWPTATAMVDLERGQVGIVTDAEPAPDDFDALCTLLELSGYHNGSDGPFTSDPGEPAEIMGACTWSLALGAILELS
jgi:hypothetical protein